MGGIVSSIFGGGQSQPTQPNVQVYQPQSTSAIDTDLANLLSANTSSLSGSSNPYAQYAPQFGSVYNSVYNSPYASGYQTAANNAGTASTGVGNQGVAASGALNSSALNLLPYANTVMNTAFDPQTALYNQDLQKVNDQSNVANAQYGLTGQQAAGNVQQADTNFNIDWQQQQLANQLAGLSGVGSAVSNASTTANTANTLGTNALANILGGGVTPYGASNTIAGNQSSALQQYIQALLGPTTSTQSTIGGLQNYLNTGVGASSDAASQANTDYLSQLQSQANLGSGLGGLASLGLQGYGAGLFGSAGGEDAALENAAIFE